MLSVVLKVQSFYFANRQIFVKICYLLLIRHYSEAVSLHCACHLPSQGKANGHSAPTAGDNPPPYGESESYAQTAPPLNKNLSPVPSGNAIFIYLFSQSEADERASVRKFFILTQKMKKSNGCSPLHPSRPVGFGAERLFVRGLSEMSR